MGEPDKDTPVEIEVFVHRTTLGDRGAMLVSLDGEASGAVWLPRSQIIDEDAQPWRPVPGRDVGAYRAVLTVPAWLAAENGLDGEARPSGIDDLFGGENV